MRCTPGGVARPCRAGRGRSTPGSRRPGACPRRRRRVWVASSTSIQRSRAAAADLGGGGGDVAGARGRAREHPARAVVATRIAPRRAPRARARPGSGAARPRLGLGRRLAARRWRARPGPTRGRAAPPVERSPWKRDGWAAPRSARAIQRPLLVRTHRSPPRAPLSTTATPQPPSSSRSGDPSSARDSRLAYALAPPRGRRRSSRAAARRRARAAPATTGSPGEQVRVVGADPGQGPDEPPRARAAARRAGAEERAASRPAPSRRAGRAPRLRAGEEHHVAGALPAARLRHDRASPRRQRDVAVAHPRGQRRVGSHGGRDEHTAMASRTAASAPTRLIALARVTAAGGAA